MKMFPKQDRFKQVTHTHENILCVLVSEHVMFSSHKWLKWTWWLCFCKIVQVREFRNKNGNSKNICEKVFGCLGSLVPPAGRRGQQKTSGSDLGSLGCWLQSATTGGPLLWGSQSGSVCAVQGDNTGDSALHLQRTVTQRMWRHIFLLSVSACACGLSPPITFRGSEFFILGA